MSIANKNNRIFSCLRLAALSSQLLPNIQLRESVENHSAMSLEASRDNKAVEDNCKRRQSKVGVGFRISGGGRITRYYT